MLRTANLDRAKYLVTNVFDTPCEQEECPDEMRDEALVAYNFERLRAELEAANPAVIVPLGATAVWAFTGIKAIDSYRGSVVKATRIVPGAKLLPTFHPARIMRQWKLLPIGVGDLTKAAAEAKLGPKVFYPKMELLIEPTLAEALDFMEQCKSSDLLSVDIETGWGQITNIGFAPTPNLAMNIPFVDRRKPNRSYWPTARQEFDVVKGIKGLCEHPVPKVGQKLIYDIYWLYEKYGIAMRNYRHDTRLMHHVLYPELPKDLGSMAASYTRIGAWKMWAGRYQGDKQDA